MPRDRDDEIKREGFECGYSLAKAVYEAGGSIALADLANMTLEDFCVKVAAQNGIRFVFVKKPDGPPETPRMRGG
jgi:hypothetical protein